MSNLGLEDHQALDPESVNLTQRYDRDLDTAPLANSDNMVNKITKQNSNQDSENYSSAGKKRTRRRPPQIAAPVPGIDRDEKNITSPSESNGENRSAAPTSPTRSSPVRQNLEKTDQPDDITRQNPFENIGKSPQNFENHVLTIGLLQTDPLPQDKHLIHPLLRIHVMDTQSGSYLKKSDPNRCVTEPGEPQDLDYILPVMSKPLIITPDNGFRAIFNEEIVLNEEYLHFIRSDVLIIFELLGLTKMSKVVHNSVSNSLYPIAWAFLRTLSSESRTCNTEKTVRLQFYRYPKKTSLDTRAKDTPIVYNIWKSKKRKEFPSSLHVSAKARLIPSMRHVTGRPELPIDIEEGIVPFEKLLSNYAAKAKPIEEFGNTGRKGYSPTLKLGFYPGKHEWSRPSGQQCKLPNHGLATFESGSIGATAMQFSSTGFYLATAIKKETTYPILVYNILNNRRVSILDGSSSVINDIQWHKNDSLIFAACEDGILRCWNVSKWVSLHLPVMLYQHVASVTACLVHPKFEEDLVIFSGSKDGFIRHWIVSQDLRKDFPLSTVDPFVSVEAEKRMTGHESGITSFAFDSDVTKLYSADSDGVIKIWVPDSAEHANAAWICFKTISDADIVGIPISTIKLFGNGRKMVIHSLDGTIHTYDFRLQRYVSKFIIPRRGISSTDPAYTNQPNLRGIVRTTGVLPYLTAKCDVTPCGTFLISGSSDGCVYTWILDTGSLISVYDKLPFDGTVQHVLFHPFENLIAFGSMEDEMPPIILYNYDSSLPRQEIISSSSVNDTLATTNGAGVGKTISIDASPVGQGDAKSPIRQFMSSSSPTRSRFINEGGMSPSVTGVSGSKRYSLSEVLQMMRRADQEAFSPGSLTSSMDFGEKQTSSNNRSRSLQNRRTAPNLSSRNGLASINQQQNNSPVRASSSLLLLDPELYKIKYTLNQLERKVSQGNLIDGSRENEDGIGRESPHTGVLTPNHRGGGAAAYVGSKSPLRKTISSNASHVDSQLSTANSTLRSPMQPLTKSTTVVAGGSMRARRQSLHRSLLNINTNHGFGVVGGPSSPTSKTPLGQKASSTFNLIDPLEEKRLAHSELRDRFVQQRLSTSNFASRNNMATIISPPQIHQNHNNYNYATSTAIASGANGLMKSSGSEESFMRKASANAVKRANSSKNVESMY